MARKLPPPGKGGAREGSGRKPDWLQQRCKDLVEKNDLLEFLADVAAGKPINRSIAGDAGAFIEVKVSADVKDRLRALEMMLDRGWGRPPQAVSVNGQIGVSFSDLASQAAKERGLSER